MDKDLGIKKLIPLNNLEYLQLKLKIWTSSVSSAPLCSIILSIPNEFKTLKTLSIEYKYPNRSVLNSFEEIICQLPLIKRLFVLTVPGFDVCFVTKLRNLKKLALSVEKDRDGSLDDTLKTPEANEKLEELKLLLTSTTFVEDFKSIKKVRVLKQLKKLWVMHYLKN
ncbi:hypothetical protein HK098_004695 [Nowakowskiella sp. JEL0407]|nr:hypothetical protein HK098_004695 [Nowakowskiella sp. JEL0407]